ncbi:MAG TPA: nuclear transport factor 2 family protein [Thermoleophilaceae bacterium]|nr:nuclear transport factor 2 family protein [Thermoleophilaceae bacterium]
MLSSPRRSARLLALLATAVLALGAVACGDSDDDGGGSASESATAGGGSDEQQARATVESLYAAIRDSDAEGVCATMTEPAQKQVAQGAIGTGKGGTCTDGFQRFLDAAERAGGLNLTLKAKVQRVKVDGDKAVARVTFGKARAGNIPLVKVDDEWKLDQAGAAPQ